VIGFESGDLIYLQVLWMDLITNLITGIKEVRSLMELGLTSFYVLCYDLDGG
jgi:hypothetical protein